MMIKKFQSSPVSAKNKLPAILLVVSNFKNYINVKTITLYGAVVKSQI